MSQLTAEMLERLALRAAYVDKVAQASINRRWGATNWGLVFPWWRKPAEVRILMYADGLVRFSGGTFGGLQYVKKLMESKAYFYVDFRVSTAHREGADATATIQGAKKLTELDILENYDEIWFFGHNNNPNTLSGEELARLDEFMARSEGSAAPKRGGVLVTGDHNNLGQGLGRRIKRAGAMRQWDTDADGEHRFSTLEEGPEPHLKFDDNVQSDDRPQKIRLTRFPFGSPFGLNRDFRPHPVMCGPDGPIDVFPDHQHEGATLEPSVAGNTDWPTKDSHQEQPYIIAYGMTKDPQVTYREFGLVSAYNGHNVNVGRIVADSSWHHWFDINLLGREIPHYMGFDATPEGEAALKKIDAYFLNCGVWLAPPERQEEMRNAAWWSILWTDRIVEIPEDAPLWYLGDQCIRALGQYASRCAVTDWIMGSPAFNRAVSNLALQQVSEQFQLFNMPFEQYIAGGVLRQLMLQVGPSNPKLQFPSEVPPDELLQSAINDGVNEGLSALRAQLESEASLLAKLFANDFRLE
jgi:hypothetical protein